MLGSLFAHLPEPPPLPSPPPRVRLRERRHACSEFIRKVKGDKYQLRWWIEVEHGGSVNCGLYASEWEAERVRTQLEEEVRKVPGRGKTALSLWLAMKPLIARGVIPAGVLPKYVRAVGGVFMGCVRLGGKGGRVVEHPERFATPESAHLAMMEMLRKPVESRPAFVTLVDLIPTAVTRVAIAG